MGGVKMEKGSAEWLEKYGKEYRAFLDEWENVRQANKSGDYSCGHATWGESCDCIIIYEK